MEKGGGGEVRTVGGGGNDGPKVEVVVTNETVIYRDTTQPGEPPSTAKEQTIQQTVEESTLDDLSSQSMVTVWGRKSGDRIIAEVLFYSNPIMFKRQGP